MPLEKLSTAAIVANGNAKRRPVSVASVVVVPASGLGFILMNVDSCDLVTAVMVAPASNLLATDKTLFDCAWAGLLFVGAVVFVGDSERRFINVVCDMMICPKLQVSIVGKR